MIVILLLIIIILLLIIIILIIIAITGYTNINKAIMVMIITVLTHTKLKIIKKYY